MEDVIGDLDSKLMLKQVALDSRLFKAEGTLSAVCRRLDRLHAGNAEMEAELDRLRALNARLRAERSTTTKKKTKKMIELPTCAQDPTEAQVSIMVPSST